MSIQWFPGHMAKARKEVLEQLKLVDVVLEVVDARLPNSSRNPMMEELTRAKPTVRVLAKADLADDEVTQRFLAFWNQGEASRAVAVNILKGDGVSGILRAAREVTVPTFKKLEKKGIRRKTIRAMVLGIPNVGKSSLINRLVGKKVVKTGDQPGITRQQQWIRTGKEFELLDTPGILWPKFEDPDVAKRLAWSGAIKSSLLKVDELAKDLLLWLATNYPDELSKRYNITLDEQDPEILLTQVALSRGALAQGGVPDTLLAAELLLRDVQSGLVGKISFDRL
ncbi:ribosome biogenesis GTPase YlqF [Sulfoacidibacillus thermotolerans]|uniref:Ribosome biogenesis GTPase A n=1 Tax=Sulfoacidibacillus thermotolerans TaxID=1765684 RepID=A0A2U3DA70_SULT2|nr:ribosome biogenesis GTPase YlqF [Sulfoacidibacillus thermotolerans]PWI58171.1 ribosome biogenesis GTPase YlqF [Sulfoacidibacillus thermotolerans]